MKHFKHVPPNEAENTGREYHLHPGVEVKEYPRLNTLGIRVEPGTVVRLDKEQCFELSRLLRAFAEDGKLPEEVGDGILLCKREEVFVTMANSYDDGGRLLGVSRKLETAKSHAEDYDHEGWKGIAMSKTLHQTWRAEAGEVTLEIQKRDIDE